MLVCPHMITHWLVYASYAIGTRDLPDIYTLSPRACGPWPLGVYIRQTTRAHGITMITALYKCMNCALACISTINIMSSLLSFFSIHCRYQCHSLPLHSKHQSDCRCIKICLMFSHCISNKFSILLRCYKNYYAKSKIQQPMKVKHILLIIPFHQKALLYQYGQNFTQHLFIFTTK